MSMNSNDPHEATDDIARDEHGCYDPALMETISSSFQNYLDFFSSMSAVTIGLSVVGVMCNLVVNQRIKGKLCNNFGLIYVAIIWSDRYVIFVDLIFTIYIHLYL